MNVIISHEGKRGCGYRTPGAGGVGIYLVGDGVFDPCARIPYPLTVCPCCGEGVRQGMGLTWINPSKLFAPELFPTCPKKACKCFMNTTIDRAGLMWVGVKYYPTTTSFSSECADMGISKKIGAVPHNFKFGKDVIYLAHPRAITDYTKPDDPYVPGVFMVFRPTGVDLVIESENDVPEKALNIAESVGNAAKIVVVKRVVQHPFFN